MPFIPNTPESFLGRSDSKNPSTTCRGITSNGRPCRRPVSSSSPPTPTKRSTRPIPDDPADEGLYCWQHKGQASLSARSSPGPRGTATPILEERTSLDTLADRLGLVNAGTIPAKKPRRGRQGGNVGQDWEGAKPARKTRPKEAKTLKFCFCFDVPIEEVPEKPKPARPQPRPVQQQMTASVPITAGRPPPSARPSQSNQGLSPSKPRPNLPANSPGKNSNRSRKSTSSQTAQYMSLIPDSTNPQTASALMAELARPYVDSEEAGFIYMFWMTPASDTSTPPGDAARSLLTPPSPARNPHQRRPSDVMSSFASKTMLLKIGRAANVQRRMNQWSRQCDYNVEVLRYYPYLPGSSEAAGVTPRMTPHCHRVERLIHIELAGMDLKSDLGACDACGKGHREWFEIKSTRNAVRTVDEVIRRWVDWDEKQGS